MKKILLIGSTGFIGKKLKIKLSKNFKLICPTKKQDFDITINGLIKASKLIK